MNMNIWLYVSKNYGWGVGYLVQRVKVVVLIFNSSSGVNRRGVFLELFRPALPKYLKVRSGYT